MYTLKCQSMFYKEGGDEERKCDIPVPHQAANRRLHRWSCLRTQCKSTGCSTYMCHPAGSRRVVQRPTVLWTKTIIDTSSSALLSRNSPPRLAWDREHSAYTTPPHWHMLFLSTPYTRTDTRTHVQQRSRFDVLPALLLPCRRQDAVIPLPPTRSVTTCHGAVGCTTLIFEGTRFCKDSLHNSFPFPFFFLLFAPTVPHARWSIGFSPKQNTFGRDELAELTLAWRLLLLPVCKQGEK